MVQVAFYKSKTRLFNRLIAWWTRGPYSHCELIVGGCAFSSSIMDGGVRAKRIDFNPAHWDIVDVPWVNAVDAVAWFEANIGKDYDVLGLLGFIIRRVEGARNRFFCSEAVAESLGMGEGWRFDPNTLARALELASSRR